MSEQQALLQNPQSNSTATTANSNKNTTNKNTTNTTVVQKKEKGPKLPVYWAVEIDNEIFEHPQVKKYLEENPHLVKLQKIHSTLLYVGKQHDTLADKITEISQHSGKKCKLQVNGFGYSETACALSILSIVLDDSENIMPSYPNKHQHITLALKHGTKAVESVETLVRENRTFVEFPDGGIVLYGNVKGLMY